MEEGTAHMARNEGYGIYGFRFQESAELPLCSLFAVGREAIDSTDYDWDGEKRTDGPLLLFQYTTSGEGIYESGGERRLSAGEAFLTEIPGRHRYRYPGGKEPWEFYFVLLRPTHAQGLWDYVKSRTGPFPRLSADSPPILLLRDLFQRASAGGISDPFVASSCVHAFLVELCRWASTGARPETDWPAAIREAADCMRTRYADMISQHELADRVGLSRFHFVRSFARHAGVTPAQYLARVRIQKAVELLGSTDWSIERIGAAVGYSSGSYFIKAFRRLTGRTPGSFRLGGEGLPYSRIFFD